RAPKKEIKPRGIAVHRRDKAAVPQFALDQSTSYRKQQNGQAGDLPAPRRRSSSNAEKRRTASKHHRANRPDKIAAQGGQQSSNFGQISPRGILQPCRT